MGAGLSVNEQAAAPGEPLPIRGSGGDRWAAHYYRALHARALQREQHWKAKALGYDQTIAQLWVLVGGLARQLEALKGRLTWLQKQLFGRKSEAGPAHGLAGAAPAATASSVREGGSEAAEPGSESAAAPAEAVAPRARGQQSGGPGPKRQRRWQLPEQVVEHRLSEAQRSCPLCGKLRPELNVW